MSVLSLPSSAGISRMRWELQRNDVMDGLQALRASDPLWRVSLEMSPDMEANSGYLKALFMRLRGPVNQLELHDWARPVPVGTYRGTLTLASGVAAGATSMSIVAATDNLYTLPETFNDTSWQKSRTAVSANQTTAPDGTLTADFLREDSTNGSHYLYKGVSVESGVDYSYSVFAKPGTKTMVILSFYSTNGAFNAGYAVFDLTAGSIAIQSGVSIGAVIRPLPDGWFRLSGWGTALATVQGNVSIGLGGNTGYLGDGASGAYVWGAKLNIGRTPTDYGYGKTLRKGDLLGIGSGTTQQVVMVTEDATSTSQGNMTVQFQPPLRNAFAGGQSVVWDKPKALFRRVSNELGWDYRGKNVITSGMAIDLIEDTRAA